MDEKSGKRKDILNWYKKAQEIRLTPSQIKTMDWVMGNPAFEEYDENYIIQENGVSPEEAKIIYEDLKSVAEFFKTTHSIQKPKTEFVKGEILDNLNRLISMTNYEGYEEYIVEFKDYKKARAKANAEIRAIQNLINKIELL